MPTAKEFTILVEWEDGKDFDADEIVVQAETKSEARAKARRLWSRTIGAEYPFCKITATRTYIEDGRVLIDFDSP
jgi:hypothetical protein